VLEQQVDHGHPGQLGRADLLALLGVALGCPVLGTHDADHAALDERFLKLFEIVLFEQVPHHACVSRAVVARRHHPVRDVEHLRRGLHAAVNHGGGACGGEVVDGFAVDLCDVVGDAGLLGMGRVVGGGLAVLGVGHGPRADQRNSDGQHGHNSENSGDLAHGPEHTANRPRGCTLA